MPGNFIRIGAAVYLIADGERADAGDRIIAANVLSFDAATVTVIREVYNDFNQLVDKIEFVESDCVYETPEIAKRKAESK